MVKDYKHQRNLSRGHRTIRMGVFLTGFILGLVVAVPVTLHFNASGKVATGAPSTAERADQTQAVVQADSRRFTFYDILTRDEILLVQQDGAKNLGAKPLIIQLGAFQNQSDADNFQAQMALLGFEPYIESVDLPEKGGHWFRVRLGPVLGQSKYKKLTDQLKSQGIQYAEVLPASSW